MLRKFIIPVLLLTLTSGVAGEVVDAPGVEMASGQVELPLATYNQLVESSRDPQQVERPAPAGYALGSATIKVRVDQSTAGASAAVDVTLRLKVLEDGWVLVPILPAGTAIEQAKVDNSPVELISGPQGLAWSVKHAGSYTMALSYRVDATRSESGYTLALPLPQAASMQLEATLPGSALDVAVIPSAGARVQTEGGNTRVSTTLPTTRGVQISWRPPIAAGHALSRARYRGELKGDAVIWQGELGVELFGEASLSLPVLPQSVTLNMLRVDGKDVPVWVQEERFRALVRGRGRHTVTIGFETPVKRQEGLPQVDVDVPPVPISSFELTLPGEKEVTVSPLANVVLRQREGKTVATTHTPLASRVSLTWTEAIPDEIKTEARANAGIYHAVHASEGVLYVQAAIDYEVTRGSTHVLRFDVPATVQVNRVVAASGAIADWRLGDVKDGRREVTVFLDRQLEGRLLFEVFYDQSLGALPEEPVDDEVIAVPLLRSLDASRQRGMIALLASQDLALKPRHEEATRIGENQLPTFFRQGLELNVLHTYKYVETLPRLSVDATPPERQQGRFDAQIATLISLGEVTLKGSSSLELNIKSGSIMELVLDLPTGVNLLSLTGPSVRQHEVVAGAEGQRIGVEFTQEMTGQLRLEVGYERLLEDSASTIDVPALAVVDAEVEQGKIAVEALSAVEVQPAVSDQLTALDVNELPQQLILRTSHPILMAYKYVTSPYRLGLTVTRHQVVSVQEAAIDRADYRTLFTRDGLAVTTAHFQVRNSGKQFLRVQLPEDSEIWSAFVDGRPEKPARATDDKGEVWHLIKIIHSTEGFPVELIFQTPARPIRGLGAVEGVLPRPEILVTRSRWDIHLPPGVRYFEPEGPMETIVAGQRLASETAKAEMTSFAEAAARQALEPLRLDVPAPSTGVRFAFEKLYANQAEERISITIPYASGFGRAVGHGLILLGTMLAWLGLGLVASRRRRLGATLALGGLVVLGVLALQYRVSILPAAWWSLAGLLVVAVWQGLKRWQLWREEEPS